MGADWPIMQKTNVNGTDCHDVYKYLRCNSVLFDQNTNQAGEIPWNWCKFLVDSNGNVVKYYGPRTDPVAMIKDFENICN